MSCPGMWNGLVPIRLPVSCSVIHVGLGFLAGYYQAHQLAWFYFLYQTTQSAIEGRPHPLSSLLRDLSEFVLGWWLGSMMDKP